MNIEVTTASNADYLWVAADRIRFLGGVPGSDLELLDIEVPPGSGTPPHIHDSPELFYILEGEMTLRQFGAGLPPQVIKAGPGTAVRVPSRVPHNYSNESDKPIRKYDDGARGCQQAVPSRRLAISPMLHPTVELTAGKKMW
ncbi:cupin domain-containing protein [Sinorhizobium meliloti]|uniref:cupin domain-containing protein n=1 Tax=Rhizobium meliloti TaxID=382 RepID=UPI000FD8ADD1|nr:cupin domain-containing protein [Sinorhizobium meliloti]RVH29286.1 cupin domain-containing protein [Sinorhizobium meliloti]